MADVRIPYTFGRGQYRAKVVTRYKDESNVTRIVESEPFPFTSTAKEYFSFVTNQNVKVDLDSMEAPNATLVDEGNYKGLDYKIYDNGLAIIDGEQTEAITAAAEETPWSVEDVTYIYGQGIFCSGFIFWNSYCLELELGPCSFSTTAISRFIGRASYQYIGGIGNIDITGLTNISYFLVFTTVEVDAQGLEDLFNDISSATVNQLTNISSFASFKVTSNQEVLLGLSIGDPVTGTCSVESASNVAYMDLPGGHLSIDTLHNYDNMFLYSIGNIGTLEIWNREYCLDDLIYCKAKKVIISCPIPQDVTEFPRLSGMSNLEEFVFDFTNRGQYTMDLSGITNYSFAFKYAPKIKKVYGMRNNVKCSAFDMTEVTRIQSMFEGCQYLEESGIGIDVGTYRDITFKKLSSSDKCLDGCVNLHENWHVHFTDPGSSNIYLNGIANSGLIGLSIDVTNSNACTVYISDFASSSSSANLNSMEYFEFTSDDVNLQLEMENVFKDNTSLKGLSISLPSYPNDDHKAGRLFLGGMCNGCTSIETVYIGGSAFGASSNVFKDCTSLKHVELDGVYAALPTYGALGQIQGYNLLLNSNSLSGCSALEWLLAPLDMYYDTYSVSGKYGNTLSLPKTMYNGGTGYTVVRYGNRIYTSAA